MTDLDSYDKWQSTGLHDDLSDVHQLILLKLNASHVMTQVQYT